MKNYLFTIFFFLVVHFSVFSQTNVKSDFFYPNKVNFHLMYSQALFYDINGSKVNLQGINFGMYDGWSKLFSFSFGFSYYFPKDYYGELIYSAMYDSIFPKELVLENNVTSYSFGLDINLTIHSKVLSLVSKSEDFAIYPQIGVTALAQTIRYKDNPYSLGDLTYQVVWNQGITLGTVNFGILSRIRIADIPFFIKISQNLLFSNQNYHIKFKTKKQYSSYLNVGIGFTFPVTKGPGVSKIKTIHYK